MTGITREELISILDERLDARSRIDVNTHLDQHEWLGEFIEEEKQRRIIESQQAYDRHQAWMEVRKSAIQWSVVGLLGGMWYAITHGKWPVF